MTEHSSLLEQLKGGVVEQVEGDDLKSVEKPRRYVRMVAPMVRYSKLPFRLLCRRYEADLAFTPMIISSSFNQSQKARDSEFATAKGDQPLIAQFAANNAIDLAISAQRIRGYVQGVDLNCGCPQKWAMKDGLGANLVQKPELISEMVRKTREYTENTIPVSVKIRLRDNVDVRNTIDLVQQAEVAGADWITIHGRTSAERRTPVHYDFVKQIKDAATVPIIANGDIFSKADCDDVVRRTGVDGVMCARGILSNPALFAGYDNPPIECLTQYLQLALQYGGDFHIHHHHLMYMMAPRVTRSERREFSLLRSMVAILDFFKARGWWTDEDCVKEWEAITAPGPRREPSG